MSRILNFLFPKAIIFMERIKIQKDVACANKQRIDKMIATLNGEDAWMLKVVRKENGNG